jgi:hypothetical protein
VLKFGGKPPNSENKKPSGFLFRFYPLRGPDKRLRSKHRADKLWVQ